MLRTFRHQPGFIRYGMADLGDKTCASISVWQTQDEAESAVGVAANWVHNHVGDRVELRTNQVGDFAFDEGIPAKL